MTQRILHTQLSSTHFLCDFFKELMYKYKWLVMQSVLKSLEGNLLDEMKQNLVYVHNRASGFEFFRKTNGNKSFLLGKILALFWKKNKQIWIIKFRGDQSRRLKERLGDFSSFGNHRLFGAYFTWPMLYWASCIINEAGILMPPFALCKFLLLRGKKKKKKPYGHKKERKKAKTCVNWLTDMDSLEFYTNVIKLDTQRNQAETRCKSADD